MYIILVKDFNDGKSLAETQTEAVHIKSQPEQVNSAKPKLMF